MATRSSPPKRPQREAWPTKMRSGPSRVMRAAVLREKACLAACPSRIPQFLSLIKTRIVVRLRMRLQRPAI
jgi:hypothetical protein